jgi:hypothetical protein
VALVAGVLHECGAPLPGEGHEMAAKFAPIRAAVGELAAAAAHKAALLRLYRVHRPEFATAEKVEELWGPRGTQLWPLLAQKYGLGVVAEFAAGLSLPEEEQYAALRGAIAERAGDNAAFL